MYRIIEIDGIFRAYICIDNKADKYGIPKEFKTRKEAEKWTLKHVYKGMSHHYEIVEV